MQTTRRADRRLDARQAARPRPRRGRVPRPPVPQPLLEPQAGPHPLRRDQLRRRAHRRRRHDLPRSTTRRSTSRRRRAARRAIEEWFGWWLADWRLDVHMTDVTQAISRRQPRRPEGARDHGRRLTDLDCSNEAFTYLDGKHGAGRRRAVPDPADRLRRRGRLRDPLPGAHGEHLWDALMEAGADARPAPFGLEPQRILRLQKMHILVGQDTDSESTPFGAAMPWIVKLDKERGLHRQLGARALRRASSPRPRSSASRWPTGTCPTEGAVVVAQRRGRRAGHLRRATRRSSARSSAWRGCRRRSPPTAPRSRSPTTARPTTPTVQTKPFYDPEGEVLRS